MQKGSLRINLFKTGSKPILIKGSIGLKKDTMFTMGKTKIKKYSDVFFPTNNYYNVDPLP